MPEIILKHEKYKIHYMYIYNKYIYKNVSYLYASYELPISPIVEDLILVQLSWVQEPERMGCNEDKMYDEIRLQLEKAATPASL